MKLAVFSSHLRALGMAFPDALTWAAERGIEAVEAASGEFSGGLTPAEYKNMLSSAGMRMISVHHSCRLSAADKNVYEEEIAGIVKAAENAKEAGASFLMLIPAALCDISCMQEKAAARERIINGLTAVASVTGSLGLTLTVENFSKVLFPFSTAEELCDMTSCVPSLRVTLDSGNFRCIGEDVISSYEAVKHKLAYCHIKDWAITEGEGFAASDGVTLRGCMLGRGVVPAGELLFRLRSDGFRGWLVIEQENPGGSMAGHIVEAVRILGAYK